LFITGTNIVGENQGQVGRENVCKNEGRRVPRMRKRKMIIEFIDCILNGNKALSSIYFSRVWILLE